MNVQDRTDGDQQDAGAKAHKKARGFFALDVNQFQRIGALNLGLEEAATYLCLLKSTDQGNVTSSGGINSVSTYTGMTRAEVKKAVERLERAGLVRSLVVERQRAKTVPRYSLPIHDKRRALAPKERPVVEAVAAGRQPEGKADLNAAQRALEKGYLERGPNGWHLVPHGNEVAFIPNSFVAVGNGNSPLRRLVTHGELGPILLAAEFYRLQNLMDERGVPTTVIRRYYTAEWDTRVGQHRLHRLTSGREFKDPKTGKKSTAPTTWWPHTIPAHDKERFWEDLRALEAMHVIEWAVYSANGKPTGDEFAIHRPQRPLGVIRNGKHVPSAPESLPAFATHLVAHLAAQREVFNPVPKDPGQLMGEWLESSPLLALEHQSVAHVEGVGILRMTHRADTENTSVWYRNARAECRDALFFVEQVARASFPEALGILQGLQERGNMGDAISMYLNAGSTDAQ